MIEREPRRILPADTGRDHDLPAGERLQVVAKLNQLELVDRVDALELRVGAVLVLLADGPAQRRARPRLDAPEYDGEVLAEMEAAALIDLEPLRQRDFGARFLRRRLLRRRRQGRRGRLRERHRRDRQNHHNGG